MANGLAPIPNLPVGNSHEWREWFFNLWESLGGAQGQIFFTDLNFTGSNITDIQVRAHNTLQGLQGGNLGGTEYYHLDATQYAAVNTGISATITTAAVTPGGATGSMTFVNGILTAQTQAT